MFAATGRIAPPASIAASLIWFHAIWMRASAVSYRFWASSASAELDAHASSPILRDSDNRSPAEARASITWVSSVPLMPISLSVSVTLPPSPFTRPMPWATRSSASIGDDRNFAANSSADVPATCANVSRDSPPSSTAERILRITRVATPPPCSARTPIEASVFDRANTSDSDAPTVFAAPAIRCAISRISDSVDAPLLPSSTRVAPNRSTPSDPSRSIVPMTFDICAIAVAASSAVRFVVSPRSTIVDVNPTMSSRFTPSWPAASATAAIS